MRRTPSTQPMVSLIAGCLAMAWQGPAAHAGPVAVTSSSSDGGQGLRISVDSGACSASQAERRISGQTYGSSGEENACERLAADGTTIQSPASVRFSAGYRVSLGSGFRVEQGAEFRVATDPGRVRGGFVRDDTPSSEPHYAARFSLNSDNLTLGADERVTLLEAEDRLGAVWLSLDLRHDSATNAYRLLVSTPDGGGTASTTEFDVQAGWQSVEVEWRASRPGRADGRVWVSHNGNPTGQLTGLANESGRVDSIRWGILGAPGTTGGYLDLDQFVSRRAGMIGAP